MVNYDGLYNKEYFGDKLNFNHFSTKKLHFKIIENGTILPYKLIHANGISVPLGGLIDGNENLVKDTLVHEGIGEVYTPNEEVLNSPEKVIFLGTIHYGMGGWGHYLTDHVKRLWFLESDIYKKYFNNCKIVYNAQGGGLLNNFARLLEILEIDFDKLQILNRPIKFRNVILPDESYYSKGDPHIFFTEKAP